MLDSWEDNFLTLDDEGHVWYFEIEMDKPQKMELENITSISCGQKVWAALDSDGNLYTFGENNFGSSGIGVIGTFDKNELHRVQFERKIVYICAGFHCVCFIDELGDVYGFGGKTGLQIGLNETNPSPSLLYKGEFPVKTICSLPGMLVLLTIDGKLYGRGNPGIFKCYFEDNSTNLTWKKIKIDENIVIKEIACGVCHIVALTIDGRLFTCGDNDYGQLGRIKNDAGENQMLECDISILDCNISRINGGTFQTYCIDVLGNLWVFGDNANNNIFVNQKKIIQIPTQVPLEEEKVQLATGTDNFSIIKTESGKIFILANSKELSNFSSFTQEQNNLVTFTEDFSKIVGTPAITTSKAKSARK